MILYEGPSRLDESERIVVIATDSGNRKTGPMTQIWILNAEHDPYESIRQRRNKSVCGSCPFQGTWNNKKKKIENRVCYVNLGQAPMSVWKKYKRGGYKKPNAQERCKYLNGRRVRIGAYGDPAAMPLTLLKIIVNESADHTGYSHQLLTIDRSRADEIAQYVMCSVDNKAQLAEAERRGYRAFLTVPKGQSVEGLSVLQCLNASQGLTCDQCRLCSGNRIHDKRSIRMGKPRPASKAPSIYIEAHAAVGNNHKWS